MGIDSFEEFAPLREILRQARDDCID